MCAVPFLSSSFSSLVFVLAKSLGFLNYMCTAIVHFEWILNACPSNSHFGKTPFKSFITSRSFSLALSLIMCNLHGHRLKKCIRPKSQAQFEHMMNSFKIAIDSTWIGRAIILFGNWTVCLLTLDEKLPDKKQKMRAIYCGRGTKNHAYYMWTKSKMCTTNKWNNNTQESCIINIQRIWTKA